MKRGQPLARKTPLTNRTPLVSHSTLRRTGNVRQVSPKRARQTRTYSVLRREFLAEWPQCQFPAGCTEPATEIQHLRGRRGERLNDVEYWASSCHDHNAWAEDHTGEALAMGWLIRIEGSDAA